MKTLVTWTPASSNPFRFLGMAEDGSTLLQSAKLKEGELKDAPTPKEATAMSMAACSAVDVVSMLAKMGQNLSSLRISCAVTPTEGTQPTVFARVAMRYELEGEGLSPERAARAVWLSFTKYCGVSAMIERSGCHVTASLEVNGTAVRLWDPQGEKANALHAWHEGQRGGRGTILVTGATRGIGHALCLELARQGYGVIPVVRSSFEGDPSLPSLGPAQTCDVTHPAQRAALKDILERAGLRLNGVVHNAGIVDPRNADAADLSEGELRTVLATNSLAPLELQRELAGSLAESGAVVLFISSRMGSYGEGSEFDYASYRLSKGLLNQAVHYLGNQAKAQGNKVLFAATHPGSVRTDMNPDGTMSPEDSARRLALFFSEGKRDELKERNGGTWSVAAASVDLRPA